MNSWEYDALKKTSLFVGLNDQEFEDTINCIKPISLSFKKGESVISSANRDIRVGMIIAGKVSGYFENVTGDRELLFTAGCGELLGVLYLFEEVWPLHINVIAGMDCAIVFFMPLFFINKNDCEGNCRAHRIIIDNLLRILTQIGLHLYRRIIFLTMTHIRQKVCYFLYDQSTLQGNIIVLQMDREALAEYLSIPRPSLSRELSLLKKEGLIDYHKRTFRILNLHMLVQYAFGGKSRYHNQ